MQSAISFGYCYVTFCIFDGQYPYINYDNGRAGHAIMWNMRDIIAEQSVQRRTVIQLRIFQSEMEAIDMVNTIVYNLRSFMAEILWKVEHQLCYPIRKEKKTL